MPTLNWRTRDQDVIAAAKVPYRLLEEVPNLSCTERDPATENMLIQGDNLEALKSLLPFYAGKVKCIFIDPPYNTKNADLGYYDDSLEHSQWLGLLYPRLSLLRELLASEGSFWLTIDHKEAHYLKVILDEIFGRSNFLGEIAYERSGVSGLGQGGGFVVNTHEHIFCYAKSRNELSPLNVSGATSLQLKDMKRYNQILEESGDRVRIGGFVAPSTGDEVVIYKHEAYRIRAISLAKASGRQREIDAEYIRNFPLIFRNTSVQEENEFQNRILQSCQDGLFSADYLVSRGRFKGERKTSYYLNGQVFAWLRDTAEIRDNSVVKTNKLSDVWSHADIPKADLANEGGVEFRRGKKPETLLRRILTIASRPSDLILDSFLGSGTTAAVALKMRRNFIGIEMGEHATTHCKARLARVVNGEQSGVSKVEQWKGGGGFRFYRLGVQVFDEEGRIRDGIRFVELAAHIWFSETRTPRASRKKSPLLGIHDATAYYLLYNGVLGDKRPDGGNVLTRTVLGELPEHAGPRVIYGESCRLSAGTLKRLGIIFKQTPYDVRAG